LVKIVVGCTKKKNIFSKTCGKGGETAAGARGKRSEGVEARPKRRSGCRGTLKEINLSIRGKVPTQTT